MAKRNKDIFEDEEKDEVRINKLLADAGICSRRGADELISSGKVLVDGVKAVTGMKVTSENVVTVDGKEIKKDRRLVLIALNKPRGIVCTTDTSEPDNVIDFLNYGKRIFPIGRLDKDSEGLLLLTNDGDIVNKILRAGNNHEKEYLVTVNKQITPEFIKGMAEGVPILDTVTDPCYVEQLSKNEFKIILTQGLNRQIRRMCEYFGYSVSSLIRVRIMNIKLGHMKTGDFRNVTDDELETLRYLIEDSENEAGGAELYEKVATAKVKTFVKKTPHVYTEAEKEKIRIRQEKREAKENGVQYVPENRSDAEYKKMFLEHEAREKEKAARNNAKSGGNHGKSGKKYENAGKKYESSGKSYGNSDRNYGKFRKKYDESDVNDGKSYSKSEKDYGKSGKSYGKSEKTYVKSENKYGKSEGKYGRSENKYGKSEGKYTKSDRSYGKTGGAHRLSERSRKSVRTGKQGNNK